MKLLSSQKNRLFDLIDASGLAPSIFLIDEEGIEISNIKTTISVKNYPFKYEMTLNKDYWRILLSPGDEIFITTTIAKFWIDLERSFAIWLSFIQREISQDDKWTKLTKEIDELHFTTTDNNLTNSKFTIQEFLEVERKIIQLKKGVSSMKLLPDQILIINDKLDQILNMATELGRFDWQSIFVGTIISIIIQLEVNKENVHELWRLIKSLFNSYLIGY